LEFELQFEWDRGNLNHAQEHGVRTDEIEQTFNDPQRCIYKAHSGNKKIIGMTEEGRIITTVYEKKGPCLVRPITSWESTEIERKAYNRSRR
jgi:uncharacterized DUF497 family protein